MGKISSVDEVRSEFLRHGVNAVEFQERVFPGETIYIVKVLEADFDGAIKIANELDQLIEGGFVTVKRADPQVDRKRTPVKSVQDDIITDLVGLLNSRSRTSEQLPSLQYVRDAAENLNIALSPRHHLIFGRRGVGKTALMVEAKRNLERQNAITLWVNFQPLRSLPAPRAFVSVLQRICDIPSSIYLDRRAKALSVELANNLRSRMLRAFDASVDIDAEVAQLVPDAQYMLRVLTEESQREIYIFLDDIHYVSTQELPQLLDMIHGITRDNKIWLKASGIKHQMRWFVDNPPTGLQTGHDAAIINLDITLENPKMARKFLSDIFDTYVEELQISNLSRVISSSAIDRLVLASGGVPRDFLVLAASSISITRAREGGRTAGVQDVNVAAGDAAKLKLQELEEDAAASRGGAAQRVETLSRIREFLLSDNQITFFQIDFLDKEKNAREYDLIQGLTDLRMVHLLNSSLSDAHQAGKRSEVYLIDLSQYSASRFKQKLTVLDLDRDALVMRKTRTSEQPRVGRAARDVNAILRRGPLFQLSKLSDLVA